MNTARDIDRPAPWESLALALALLVLASASFWTGSQPVALDSAAEMGLLSEQGDLKKQLVLGGLYLGATGLLVWRTDLRQASALGAGLGLLLAWCIASFLWSDLPALSLRRSAALLGTVLIGLYAGLRFDYNELERAFCQMLFAVIVLSLILAVAVPSLGLDIKGRLRGVFSHKNSLGLFSGLGIVCVVARCSRIGWRGAWLEWVALIGCVICVLGARSASPLPTMAFALVALGLARRQPQEFPVLLISLLGLAMFAGFLLPWVAADLGAAAELLGRDADFSGRILVWEFSIDLLSRVPLLGFGFDTFWNGSAGLLFLKWARFAVPHAHNGYLQLALDAGAIGLLLYGFAFSAALLRTGRLLATFGPGVMGFPIAFIAYFLLANYAEGRMWSGNDPFTVLLVAVIVRARLMDVGQQTAMAPPLTVGQA